MSEIEIFMANEYFLI